MTFYVGDDSTVTYPVTDAATPPGDLSFAVIVTAWKADGTNQAVSGAAWLGNPGNPRDLEVPLGTLPAGLWSLRLAIANDADLFLGNVVIQ